MYTSVCMCVCRCLSVFICILSGKPYLPILPIATLIVSALMLQSLACPLGHMLTFCIKTFQLKIVAPSINLAPLSMCFSLVPIPVEKMKNVFYAFSPEGGCESYPLTGSVIPFTKGLYLLQALAIGFLSKRRFRKWCMKH